MNPMNRRDFLVSSAAAASVSLVLGRAVAAEPARRLEPPKIPLWRGFNLPANDGKPLKWSESDFDLMARWGFNFARLPMSYWSWAKPSDWLNVNEAALSPVDQAIDFGRRHGIHVNLNLHRIPGYCVNRTELEPMQLFTGPRESMEKAQQAAVHHWRVFARRYRAISSTQLSFDLINEPPHLPDQTRYQEVARALIAAIREESPDRLIFVDGADVGRAPVLGLEDLGVVQSARGYDPMAVSHHRASWVPSLAQATEPPQWPYVDKRGRRWDRERLKSEVLGRWRPLLDGGFPVHVGEWGCFNKTPHDVCLAWMSDWLSVWKEAGLGWALWNFRGSFGVLDSGRADVAYEDFEGHKLDRKMLELLRAG